MIDIISVTSLCSPFVIESSLYIPPLPLPTIFGEIDSDTVIDDDVPDLDPDFTTIEDA